MRSFLVLLWLALNVNATYRVYLFIGQSNMAGGNTGVGVTTARVDDAILKSVLYGDVLRCSIAPATQRSDMLIPTLNKIREYRTTDTLIGINMAVGATRLKTVGSGNSWAQRTVGTYFYNATKLTNTTIDTLQKQGKTVVFDGVFWNQGESDSDEKTTRAEYFSLLKQLANDIRDTCNSPNAHFYSFQTGRYDGLEASPNVGMSWIRQAQLDFDMTDGGLNHLCGVTVNLPSYPLKENVHYDSIGLLLAGEMLGNTYNSVSQSIDYAWPKISSWTLVNDTTVDVVCDENVTGAYKKNWKDQDRDTAKTVTINGSNVRLTFDDTVYAAGYLPDIDPYIDSVTKASNNKLLVPTGYNQLKELWPNNNLVWLVSPQCLKNGMQPASFRNGAFPVYSPGGNYTAYLTKNIVSNGYLSEGALLTASDTGNLMFNQLIPDAVFNGSFTISVWFEMVSTINTFGYIFLQRLDAIPNYYFVFACFNEQGFPVFGIRNGAVSNIGQIATDKPTLTIGQKYFVEFIKSGATLSIRINGVRRTPIFNTPYTFGTISTVGAVLSVGNAGPITGYQFKQKILSLAVYSEARDSAQGKRDYFIGPDLFDRNLFVDNDSDVVLTRESPIPGSTINSAEIASFTLFHTGSVDSVRIDNVKAALSDAATSSVRVTPVTPLKVQSAPYTITLFRDGVGYPKEYRMVNGEIPNNKSIAASTAIR